MTFNFSLYKPRHVGAAMILANSLVIAAPAAAGGSTNVTASAATKTEASAKKPDVSPPQATEPNPEYVAKGKRHYKDFCQKCHGLNLVTPGGGFYDLRKFPLDDKPRFVKSVTKGKRAMPAWGNVLKADDLDQLWAYIQTGGKPLAK